MKQYYKGRRTKLKDLNDDWKWFIKSEIIASFSSFRTEISTSSLNQKILNMKKILCLPAIINNENILNFFEHKIGDVLVSGKYGILEPKKKNKLLPKVIIIPCLAFDLYGYRLGYGGGYYDKTIQHYKKIRHSFISVGFAYEDQKIEKVLQNDFDQRLDYILTEKQLYKAK